MPFPQFPVHHCRQLHVHFSFSKKKRLTLRHKPPTLGTASTKRLHCTRARRVARARVPCWLEIERTCWREWRGSSPPRYVLFWRWLTCWPTAHCVRKTVAAGLVLRGRDAVGIAGMWTVSATALLSCVASAAAPGVESSGAAAAPRHVIFFLVDVRAFSNTQC